jgi:hypothetical protein
VDVTRVKIQRPTIDQHLYYSVHDSAHVLKFEVVCCTSDKTRIIWVNGGFGGNNADVTISREFGLFDELLETQCLIADFGYRGNDPKLWTGIFNPRDQDELNHNFHLNRLRSRIERINRRIKIYSCFNQRWRHSNIYLSKCF